MSSGFGGGVNVACHRGSNTLSNCILSDVEKLLRSVECGSASAHLGRVGRGASGLGSLRGGLGGVRKRGVSVASVSVVFFSVAVLLITVYLCRGNAVKFSKLVISAITVVDSFNSITTLSGLTNGLARALTDNREILSVLSRDPIIRRGVDNGRIRFSNVRYGGMNFTCSGRRVLRGFGVGVPGGGVVTVGKPDNSNGSATLGLVVHF